MMSSLHAETLVQIPCDSVRAVSHWPMLSHKYSPADVSCPQAFFLYIHHDASEGPTH